MLKKKLGIEAIEKDWRRDKKLTWCFKIPSTLIIPEGCERIGNGAFHECKSLEEVEIPEGVMEIRNCVFENCERLRKVTIPRSIVWISDYAFWGCINATVILKSPNMFTRYNFVFERCKNVKEETGN